VRLSWECRTNARGQNRKKVGRWVTFFMKYAPPDGLQRTSPKAVEEVGPPPPQKQWLKTTEIYGKRSRKILSADARFTVLWHRRRERKIHHRKRAEAQKIGSVGRREWVRTENYTR